MPLTKTLRYIWTHPLNRRNRWQGIAQFLRWQMAMRLTHSSFVYRGLGGVQAIISIGESGLTQNVYCGLHEYAEMLFALHCLRPGDLFVDVGANVGAYTLLACGVAGATGIAIEPVPATFKRLQDNIYLNRLADRSELIQCGVGARAETLFFTQAENCMNHVLANSAAPAGAVAVPVRTLDELLAGKFPFMIKIDVEGYEAAVLQGAQATLQCPTLQAVILELNGSGRQFGYDDSEVMKQMRLFGYQPATYDPFRRQVIELEGKCSSSDNTLFVRELDSLQIRIRTAEVIRINHLEL